MVAGILLNQQTLLVQEIIGLPGCKAPVIQYLVMIHKHLCGLGESDFIESGVDFTPESSAPGIIQFFDIIMIFIPQEITERYFRGLVIIELYGRLIVELPAHNTGIVAIMLRQFFYHLVGKLPIAGRSERGMLTCTVVEECSVFVFNQDFRIFAA